MNSRITLAIGISTLALALAACNNDRTGDETAGARDAGTLSTDAGRAGEGMRGAGDRTAMNDPAGAGALGDDAFTADRRAGGGATAGMDDAAGNVSQEVALAMVMAVDQHEIAAAEQARGKQLSGEAGEYAQTLLKDHTRNLEATRGLMGQAGGAGDDVPGADDPQVAQMREKHAAERERLGRMDGDEYQRAWIDAMVTGHTEALEMLDDQLIPSAGPDNVRKHLQDTRQTIARHLETAQRLRDQPGDGNR
ncbi:DUF4142 domain-containing protein [Lysobacter sp. GX 14042]|uniref:DUF4142 domain-containing protein n=1 Tax=Lysobacter sp. GX 14042 TaxID=2907155 RepID=UPI001F24E5E3|nr:DUF4142 domain-containing protein [Lysobacter sp. GX 14042]MCE7031536.1 DUF4142 domain-containing protein [Lysobacter sp. GX 14042]